MVLIKRNFYTSRLYSEKRIKPHNLDVLSILIGNLLGDGFAEKRNNATRFHIHISNRNAEYIFWLHLFLSKNKYCSAKKPKIKKQIKKNNVIYFSIKFKTFSFSSLNYLHDYFYVKQKINEKVFFKKKIPKNISTLLNDKAFAIWFLNNRNESNSSVKISTENFSFNDSILLQQTILKNFSLHCSIQKHKDKFIFYFKKKDKIQLFKIIKPYMINSMYYKLD